MSLDGLDAADLKEAHEAAAAEPGGWFLLQYASRNEVQVHDHGTGGIVEIRTAIAKYEDSSPLYGFLRYRRRSVIIKYQPEDCSRLVQARASVHFNAICERLSPYDTTFEISVAKELKDTTLSEACAASGSISSSTSSLRRRRLLEIAEEQEEAERERKRRSIEEKAEEVPGPGVESDAVAPLSPPLSSHPDFASTVEPPNFSGAERPASPAKSDWEVGAGRRFSTQSGRPDLYSSYGRAKVKLAPRPSLDANRRAQTAANFKRISALPAGLKLHRTSSKKEKSADKEEAQELNHAKRQKTLDIVFAPPTPITEIPPGVTLLPPRPNTSSGASMTSPSRPSSAMATKISPEKARLMKAMKLREKKRKESMLFTEPPPAVEALSEHRVSTIEEQDAEDNEQPSDDNPRRSLSKADSGIAIDASTPAAVNAGAHADDNTTDSHPTSPTADSSEVGESTKASSLSESTEETVRQTEKATEEVAEGDGRNNDNKSDHEQSSSASGKGAASEPTQEAVKNGSNEVPISGKEDARTSQESRNIPVKATTQSQDTINQPSAVDVVAKELWGIGAQEAELPTVAHEATPTNSQSQSPQGVPHSKFSTNDAKAKATPSLKSKFSTQDLRAPADPVPALPTIVVPDPAPPTSTTPEPQTVDEEPSPTDAPNPESSTEQSKPKTAVDQIKSDIGKDTPNSEISDPLLDDDALMDELQAAEVQEAHSMMVSKSPITPVFPTSGEDTEDASKPVPVMRAASNPMRGPLLAPGDVRSSSARSVSAGGAAFLHDITSQPSSGPLQAKKVNVGSSIANRIKALEQLSGRSNDDRPKSPAPSTSFFNVRRLSMRPPSRAASGADPSEFLSAQQPGESDVSRDASPDGPPHPTGRVRHGRSGSVANRLSVFEGPGVHAPRGRPESIQVTARIVRDPSRSQSRKTIGRKKEEVDYSTVDFKQSPLLVDHQQAERDRLNTPPSPRTKLPEASTIHENSQEEQPSREAKTFEGEHGGKDRKKRRSSMNFVKDFIREAKTSVLDRSSSSDSLAATSPAPPSAKSSSRPPSVHQNNGGSLVRRLSISSRRSSASRERDVSTPVTSPSVHSDAGSGDDEKSGSEKKSRASRFMRRLSSSLGPSRKTSMSHISPTVVEEKDDEDAAAADKAEEQPTTSTHIGEVNVQFPDNLLWKRRSMCLDSKGFLILSAVKGTAANVKDKAGVKRYHLSDFLAPYMPDIEVQELPNSVALDLVNGSGLQIACKDRTGQQNVLHLLQDAHQSHTSFGK